MNQKYEKKVDDMLTLMNEKVQEFSHESVKMKNLEQKVSQENEPGKKKVLQRRRVVGLRRNKRT